MERPFTVSAARKLALDLACHLALYSIKYSEHDSQWDGSGTAMVKIRSERLTTCRVTADGGEVGLEFLDSSGATVRLELPIEDRKSAV